MSGVLFLNVTETRFELTQLPVFGVNATLTSTWRPLNNPDVTVPTMWVCVG